ncbi:MAG TPA: dihydrodipicolinate synthase family protein [Candidatus Limnocylindrales bacterium]
MVLTGLFVPLITPFDAAGAVALPALETLAHDVLSAGAAGLVALGTTGEPGSLTPAERRDVVDVAARVCRERRARLIVGTDAAFDGRPEITAALSVVPPFVRPGEEGVIAHFTALASASPVPLVIYHVPYRTAQTLSAQAIRRLAAIPGVIGIKLAAGGIDADTIELLADPPEGFAILGGEDQFLSPLLALGAHGGITASAHVATGHFTELASAWRAGSSGHARTLGHRLAPLAAALFAEPNPTVIKGVLHAQSRIPTADVRLPLLPAAAESVRSALDAHGAVTQHGDPRIGEALRADQLQVVVANE